MLKMSRKHNTKERKERRIEGKGPNMRRTAFIILSMFAINFAYAGAPSDDTIVYQAPGKRRSQVMGCKRLTKDSEELKKIKLKLY